MALTYKYYSERRQQLQDLIKDTKHEIANVDSWSNFISNDNELEQELDDYENELDELEKEWDGEEEELEVGTPEYDKWEKDYCPQRPN